MVTLKIKKLFTIGLSLAVCAAALIGCTGKKADLALITDAGTVEDQSFNQGAWEGLVKYAEENKVSHKYYQPDEKSTDAFLVAIDTAVKAGAKLVVTPGSVFEEAVSTAQDFYPDVKFVLIDGNPRSADGAVADTASNTVGVSYAEEQSGFLAGYAAVKDGMTSLGFMANTPEPGVVRYGYGFVQGVEYAATEMSMEDGTVKMKYAYTDSITPATNAQSLAGAWYESGTEVVFACGETGGAVMEAATAVGAKVIGVDVDQADASPAVVTSAMKGLGTSVYHLVKEYYEGAFPGGQNLVLDAADGGVSIAMETGKFEKFTQVDYDAIFAKLVNDTDRTASDLVRESTADGLVSGSPIVLTKTVVEEIK